MTEPLRVLVVEDDCAVLESLVKLLNEEFGCVAVGVGSYGEAIFSAAQNQAPFSLAFIDYLLPRNAGERPEPLGLELMSALKQRPERMEVVIMTGLDNFLGIEAMKAGAMSFVNKPLSVREIGVLVGDVLRRRDFPVGLHRSLIEGLIKDSRSLFEDGDEDVLLNSVLESVRQIGFDRIRLYVPSDDGLMLVGRAHLGMSPAFVNSRRLLAQDRYALKLLQDPRIHHFMRDPDGSPSAGARDTEYDDAEEWVCVPLIWGQELIGKLSADNALSGRAISNDQLGLLALLSSQASAILHRTSPSPARTVGLKSPQALLRVSDAFSASIDITTALSIVCQSVVELLGVSHSAVVLFDPVRATGIVTAEYPRELGTLGTKILLKGVPAEERLLRERSPVVFHTLESAVELGPVRETLLKLGVSSMAVVPIFRKGRLWGSLSMDAVGHHRAFTGEELEMCMLFAAQAAFALDAAYAAEQAERVRRAVAGITSETDRATLLGTIATQAKELLQARSAGVYEYDADRESLFLVAESGRPEHLGSILRLGEGMGGRLVRSGEPYSIVDDYNAWPGRALLYGGRRLFGAVIEVPLRWQAEVIGILYVDDRVGRKFTELDARALQGLADHAAIALTTCDYNVKEAEYDEVVKLSERLLESLEVKKCFNLGVAAAVKLLNADFAEIILPDRAGNFVFAAVAGDWEPRMVDTLRLDRNRSQAGYVIRTGGHVVCDDTLKEERFEIPRIEHQMGVRSSLGVPLTREGQVVGALSVHTRHPRHFRNRDILLLKLIASQIAIAWHAGRQFEAGQKNASFCRALLRASEMITDSSRGLREEQVLKELLHQAVQCVSAPVLLATVERYDDGSRDQEFELIYPEAEFGPLVSRLGRRRRFGSTSPSGITGRAALTKLPQLVNDVSSDKDYIEFHEETKSELAIPLVQLDQVVAVLNVESREYSAFDETDVETLKALTESAAIAIQTGRALEDLAALHEATQQVSRGLDLESVMQDVASAAQKVFSSQFASLRPYDPALGKFIPKTFFASNFPIEDFQALRSADPLPGGMTYSVLQKGRLVVADIDAPDYPGRGGAKEVFRRLGIKCFQGIALREGGDPVGVLYLSYNRLGAIGPIMPLQSQFIAFAALALKRAILVDQVARAQAAAAAVARVTAIGDLQETLETVARETQSMLRCDAVALYAFDQTKGRLHSTPGLAGVRKPDRARLQLDVEPGSLVYAMLHRTDPYLAEDVMTDRLLKSKRFAVEEEIRSCIAVPLKSADTPAGVLFVNYRFPHAFSSDELSNIGLLGNQSAIAIRNAQLFEERSRLLQISTELLKAVTPDDVLNCAASFVPALLGVDVCFVVLWSRDEEMHITSTFGSGQSDGLNATLEALVLSHAKFVVGTGTPVAVPDFYEERRFVVPAALAVSGVRSGVAVPMLRDGKVMGAMLAYSRRVRQYGDETMNLLCLVSNQAASAVWSKERSRS